MASVAYDIGVVGLGVMGRNLLLNLADHGFAVAGFDKDLEKVESLRKSANGKKIYAAETTASFLSSLRQPRALLLLVPAGAPVDGAIEELTAGLSKGDVIIDGGNSHFRDTEAREKKLALQGIHFFGMGISGGEAGARKGPSLMPGGSADAYARVQPIFEAVAAQADGEPCIAHLGSGPSGHYVKMIHNGIEYALMELIAETYQLLKRGLGLGEGQIKDVFARWNEGEMKSFLIEITAEILGKKDDVTGKWLLEVVSDVAKQKGTGKWTSDEARNLQVPVPTIDTAVTMRDLSGWKRERDGIARQLGSAQGSANLGGTMTLAAVGDALYVSMVLTFAQGFSLLSHGSEAYGFGLRLERVAKIWRGGCIIRAALLNDIAESYRKRPELPHLLLDAKLGAAVFARRKSLCAITCASAEAGLPAPAFASALAYFDAFRDSYLPLNLVQAQRDYFGAHGYERTDKQGTFHSQWGTPD